MTEKENEQNCGGCKQFQIDGMFGMWCNICDKDYPRYEGNCPHYEKREFKLTKKLVTVRDLAAHLLHLVETGQGGKYVELSVNYDNCDHIQKLSKVYDNEGFDWITLAGGKE